MSTIDWVEITRSESRAYPYRWRCLVPITTGLITEPCGTWSVASSRKAAEKSHRAHFAHEHAF